MVLAEAASEGIGLPLPDSASLLCLSLYHPSLPKLFFLHKCFWCGESGFDSLPLLKSHSKLFIPTHTRRSVKVFLSKSL